MGMLGDPVLWVDPNVLKACSDVLSDACEAIMFSLLAGLCQ